MMAGVEVSIKIAESTNGPILPESSACMMQKKPAQYFEVLLQGTSG
jgi:hypothetical protein